MREFKQLGHQAPKGYRINRFNSIEINGDLHYCKSHNFVYNNKAEKEKLHNGLPCFYTDARFEDYSLNFYKKTKIHWTRWKDISLKACIRKVLECKGIPAGTIVEFNKSWYYTTKKIDNGFIFKVRKENPIDIKYEVSSPCYFNNFQTCEFSQKLTDRLRQEGFLVQVWNKNPDWLIGEEEGEIAIAYGYGKKIGFSSAKNTFRGYTNGCDNVLYDRFREFDKWSKCNQISKSLSIDEIVSKLKQ